MNVFLVLYTKVDILKNVGNHTVSLVSIDFHGVSVLLFFSILWNSLWTSSCLVTHIIQNIFFLCSTEERGLEQLEGEYTMASFSFSYCKLKGE